MQVAYTEEKKYKYVAWDILDIPYIDLQIYTNHNVTSWWLKLSKVDEVDQQSYGGKIYQNP